MKRFFALLVGFFIFGSPAVSFSAVGPGDIVTPQSDNFGTVIVVHPNSGNREILSLFPSTGTGPKMSRPESIATLPDNSFLIADTFAHEALTRFDVATENIAGGDICDQSDNWHAKLDLGQWHWKWTVTVLGRYGGGNPRASCHLELCVSHSDSS